MILKFKAVYNPTNSVSTNSFTLDEIASYYEHEWEFSDGSILPSNDVETGDLTYLQYMGQNDKNNIELYVGDIVKCKAWSNEYEKSYYEYISEITFINGVFSSRVHTEECEDGFYSYGVDELEKIGNIYENKELLTKKEG